MLGLGAAAGDEGAEPLAVAAAVPAAAAAATPLPVVVVVEAEVEAEAEVEEGDRSVVSIGSVPDTGGWLGASATTGFLCTAAVLPVALGL